jgi:hypothetical protein
MVVTAYVAKISEERSEVNCPLTFEARPYLQVSRSWGQRGENIVGRYGSANALERKLPNRLDGYGVFDRHQHAWANQYLTGLRFVAQTRGDIADSPDRGVVESTLETDSPQRSETVRYPDAEPNIVPEPPPLLRQCANGIAHF